MSTRTANYQLHQWVPEDQFLREEFNEDHVKIDTAIRAAYDRAGTVQSTLTAAVNKKADQSTVTNLQTSLNTAIGKKADQTALTALQTTVGKKVEIVVGSYSGTGTNVREITVGFRPKLVFVERQIGKTYEAGEIYGGWFSAECPLSNGSTNYTQITNTGFRMLADGMNTSGYGYYYVCFR